MPSGWVRALAWAMLAALVASVAMSWAEGGIVSVLMRPDLPAAAKIESLRQFFAGLGTAAPLVYVVVVTIEVVVAPIPGTVLYAPAGVIFGGWWGGWLSLAGNVVGAVVSFMLMRVLGRAAFERWLRREHLEELEQRLVDHGVLVIFLLRVNPVTSSDVVSYAAGATAMPVWKLALGTTLGMAPLCFLQSYLAEGLLSAYPRLIYPVLLVGLVYAAVFIWMLRNAVVSSAARTSSRGSSE
jgi:uncharacterized membrane protein YdjX (TVP38/TMEM64 family)